MVGRYGERTIRKAIACVLAFSTSFVFVGCFKPGLGLNGGLATDAPAIAAVPAVEALGAAGAVA